MNIHNCNKYNFESIELTKPLKEHDYYYSDINFLIQTPKLPILKLNKNTLTLNINTELEQCISEFDKNMINLISNNSEEYFKESFTSDEIDDIYKSSIKINKNKLNTFNCAYSDNLTIFKKNKSTLSISDLNIDNDIICLLKCSKIIFYKTYCMPYWEIIQIKLKEIKIEQKVYLFKEDAFDDYVESNNNFKLINFN